MRPLLLTSVDLALRYLYQLGFSEEQGKETLRELFTRRYCEARQPVEMWTDTIREIRITPLGKYHITDLVKTFVYMDAITVDTPILDHKVRALVTDVYQTNNGWTEARDSLPTWTIVRLGLETFSFSRPGTKLRRPSRAP